MQTDARLERDLQSRVCPPEFFHGLPQIELHTFPPQMLVHKRRHRKVYRPHHLVCHLDDRHFHACMNQILCHFKPDEPSADNYRAFHLLLA